VKRGSLSYRCFYDESNSVNNSYQWRSLLAEYILLGLFFSALSPLHFTLEDYSLTK